MAPSCSLPQVEAAWLEGRIRQEFDKLREFLRVEEQTILDAMAEEAREKQRLAEGKMKRLAEDTEALAHEIERLQVEMKEDDVSFLMVRGLPPGFSDRDQVFRSRWGARGPRPWPTPSSHSLGVLGPQSPRRKFSDRQEAKRVFIRVHFSLPLSPFLLPGPSSLVLTLALFSFLLSLLQMEYLVNKLFILD